jgi:hypothetical protein
MLEVFMFEMKFSCLQSYAMVDPERLCESSLKIYYTATDVSF